MNYAIMFWVVDILIVLWTQLDFAEDSMMNLIPILDSFCHFWVLMRELS